MDDERYLIQEFVNGDFYRYYEFEPVQNKLYMIRLTMYSKVNPNTFNKRGKDVYRCISYLRNFISS